ncbi:hypothetical protein [Azospirillum doebereinerae]
MGSPDILEVARIGSDRRRAMAAEHAARVVPIIDEVRKAGVTTLSGIAEALNARGVRTARGGHWHGSTVRNILSRPMETAGT